MARSRARNSELADLTVSMLLSLAYFVAICWIFPVIPMILVLMYGLSFTVFLILWIVGLPFTGLAFYYFYKTRQ